jgi:2-polyprenyl-3-methyl-5-hydroxy-6-metoxy-1,4-benzoquinol methylase
MMYKNQDTIIQHFSCAAKDYQKSSETFPWSWLRKREEKAVFNTLGPIKGACCLDIGCGAGYYTRLMVDAGCAKVLAVDLSQEMIDALPTNREIEGIVGDSATFDTDYHADAITMLGLLEFVPDPVAVLTNAQKFSTKTTKLVILAPKSNLFGHLYKYKHQRHGVNISTYSEEDIKMIAAASGWGIETITFVLPFSIIVRLKKLLD